MGVRVRGLVKQYGALRALDGLDLSIERGAFYALLGPNGAGKSTTLAILTGVLAPDAGDIEVLGIDVRKDPLRAKALIGIVPEELSLFERLTGRQHVTYCGRLYGLSGDVAARRADELLEVTGLSAKGAALVADYSKGMRRRLALASALVHGPQLLLLDEPFEGVDVVGAAVIRELLRELVRRGVTLVLTTHVLEIADRFATHAGVLAGGRLRDEGEVSALLARHGASSLSGVLDSVLGAPSSSRAQLSFFPDGAAG